MKLKLSKSLFSFENIVVFGTGIIIGRFLLPHLAGSFANIPDKCTDDPGVPRPSSGTPGWYWVTKSGCNTHHHCTIGQTWPGATCQQTSGGHGGGGYHGGHGGGGKHGG